MARYIDAAILDEAKFEKPSTAFERGWNAAMAAIFKNAPTADVRENVHARWVKVGQSFLNPNRFRNYACSKCGFDIEQKKFNYCPNCGAMMDERREE